MDAQQLLDRLQQPTLLKSDDKSDWDKITATYPYFTIAHWMKHAHLVFHSEGELNKVAMFKTDPIQFAEWIHSMEQLKSMPASEQLPSDIKPVETAPETASTSDAEPEISITANEEEENFPEKLPEKSPAKETKTDAPPMAFSEEVKEKELENEPAESPKGPVGATFMQEHEIDILDLIRDLPNSSPFEIQVSGIESTDAPKSESPAVTQVQLPVHDESAEEEDNEEDKSLMVMMSFTDWLKHFKRKHENEKEEARAQKALKAAWQKEKLAEAADEEAEEIPEPIFRQAMESISLESSLISESLAEILARQGKKEKAIAMYKKLSLRNPEKSAYFADRISELSSMID